MTAKTPARLSPESRVHGVRDFVTHSLDRKFENFDICLNETPHIALLPYICLNIIRQKSSRKVFVARDIITQRETNTNRARARNLHHAGLPLFA